MFSVVVVGGDVDEEDDDGLLAGTTVSPCTGEGVGPHLWVELRRKFDGINE